MKTMSKEKDFSCPAMSTLFSKQKEFQKQLNKNVPMDAPSLMSEHLLGLLTEVGEVLHADERWKTNGRCSYYNRDEKLEELADCLIYLINACLYSDVSSFEIMNAIGNKITKNVERL